MNMMTLPHTNGSAKGMQKLWLTLTVEEYFSAINWDDRPPELTPLSNPAALSADGHDSNGAAASTLSLTLSVSRFFDLFPWDGQRAIAAPLAIEAPIAEETSVNDITLEDFSDLF